MKRQCRTCRFWESLGGKSKEDGWCFRMPPVPVLGPKDQYPHGLQVTTYKAHWCGEHQPKDNKKAKP